MENLALKEAKQHVLFQHEGADGWITMAQKDPRTGRFRQYHYKPEELADHLSEWMGENVFFSQNTFYTARRSVETVRQLRSLYVDLDVYTKGLDPEWVLRKLELEEFGESMPDPNMVIFSGQGLVLIWHIEPVPYKAMSLWIAVEKYLINTLKDLGADSKASDPARVFRVAGSINSKNGAMVKAEYRHDYRYDIHQIQYEYLPELTPPKKPTRGRKKQVVRMFNVYTLHIARVRDIARLVELRHGNMKECREYACFLYRYFTCCVTDDPADALEATLDLNSRFTIPLPEREVIKATESAEKAWRAKNDKKANEIAKSMGYPGAGYNIKNVDLIDWLNITEEEEQEMSTIISKRENRRREKKKRHEEGVLPREEYLRQQQNQTDSKVELLKKHIEENPSISIRKLAEITGMSKSAVQRLKTKI